MAKVYLDDTTLTGIANQTRRLKQSQETYKPSQMVTALSTVPIPSTPTGTINITQNGTTDVTDYATANVNVQPNLQNKQVSITTNTTTTVQKDTGYDGLDTVTVTTNVPTPAPDLQSKSVTITENTTTTVTPDTGKDGLSSVEITTNVSGGGGGLEEKDVNFYDYDGTLLHSYTKTDFLALTEMPENPTHEGLTAQGWNWDLADAKTHVTEYGILDVGQVYTTASGLSEFDIELNAQTGLTMNLMMDGTKNWGDGTSDTNTSHTYSTAGEYTITCNGTNITPSSSSNNICDIAPSNGSHNFYIKNIRITNISSLPNYSFTNLRNLKTIILSNDTTTIGDRCFLNTGIKHLTLPKNFKKISIYMCASNFYLESVSFAKDTYLYSNITNVFSGCYNLKRAIIPNTYLGTGSLSIQNNTFSSNFNLKKYKHMGNARSIGSSAFANCINAKEFDFTKISYNFVTPLDNVNAFQNINPLIAKIVVPDSLYSTWITASNWTAYADIIVKESDYNAS